MQHTAINYSVVLCSKCSSPQSLNYSCICQKTNLGLYARIINIQEICLPKIIFKVFNLQFQPHFALYSCPPDSNCLVYNYSCPYPTVRFTSGNLPWCLQSEGQKLIQIYWCQGMNSFTAQQFTRYRENSVGGQVYVQVCTHIQNTSLLIVRKM